LFMLKAVEETARQTIARIKEVRLLLSETIEEVQKKAPKIYRKELVELLFEQPYSKIEFVVKVLNVERKAASRYLRELEAVGILESRVIGRETIYVNKALLEVLSQ